MSLTLAHGLCHIEAHAGARCHLYALSRHGELRWKHRVGQRRIAAEAAKPRERPSATKSAEERQLQRDVRWLASKKDLRTRVEVPADLQRVLGLVSTWSLDDPDGAEGEGGYG